MKKFLSILFLINFTLWSCGPHTPKKEFKINGLAQGTYYAITYFDKEEKNLQPAIDSFFKAFDFSASNYLNQSIISRFNRNDTDVVADNNFTAVFNKAMEVSAKTNGAFDITVMPLINAWGFGFTDPMKLDSAKIDSILPLIDYRNVQLINGKLVKKNPDIMIDFNAIAQGYSADLIGQILESKGIQDYLIDVGGEVLAKGTKAKKELWRVGIEQPAADADAARTLNSVVKLENKALATSGNYRKYIIKDGKRYSHTIDPKTGFPVEHTALSVSVLADDCMTADAYATAFMVMGVEKTKAFLDQHPELEAYIIYSDKNDELKTWGSKGLLAIIENEAPATK